MSKVIDGFKPCDFCLPCCPDKDLEIKVTKSYAYDKSGEYAERTTTLVCKNERLCERAMERAKIATAGGDNA